MTPRRSAPRAWLALADALPSGDVRHHAHRPRGLRRRDAATAVRVVERADGRALRALRSSRAHERRASHGADRATRDRELVRLDRSRERQRRGRHPHGRRTTRGVPPRTSRPSSRACISRATPAIATTAVTWRSRSRSTTRISRRLLLVARRLDDVILLPQVKDPGRDLRAILRRAHRDELHIVRRPQRLTLVTNTIHAK